MEEEGAAIAVWTPAAACVCMNDVYRALCTPDPDLTIRLQFSAPSACPFLLLALFLFLSCQNLVYGKNV